jgi:hypothetical protein
MNFKNFHNTTSPLFLSSFLVLLLDIAICILQETTFLFFPAPVLCPCFLNLKLSHVVTKFFFLFFLKSATFQYNTVFVIFFACALLFVLSLLCSPLRFFSGSHFLCPPTFFFVVSLFPLSPFSPPHIPPPTQKPLVSPFLHSISTIPPLLLFSYVPLHFFPFPFSSFAIVLSFFCISCSYFARSLSMNIFSGSIFSQFSLLFHHFFSPTKLLHFHYKLIILCVITIFTFTFLYVFFYKILCPL